ncbi:MAG: hypothetical protein ACU0A9_17510 [Alterinioella nitratireducens]|uniref:hypothetical protein n=1 Tax=Alterinioella nitratireducens TaxID=2735915 RepID=UPI0040581013
MRDVIRILLPLLLWLASFSAIYGLHGIGCAFGWPGVEVGPVSLFRGALLAAWLVALLAQIGVLVALRSERFGSSVPFSRWTSLALGWVGLVATIWTLHPVAVISTCGVVG